MQEKRTDIVKVQAVIRTIPPQQQLMRVNWSYFGVVVFLMIIVFVLGFIYSPATDTVNSYTKIDAAKMVAQGTNPVVSKEVNELKSQLIGLVSGSIESKLSALEASIKSGTVDNSLGTIADLKNDLKVLRTYSDANQKGNAAITTQELAEELSQLKRLMYAIIASCALMFVALVGVWIKQGKHLPYKDIKSFLDRR